MQDVITLTHSCSRNQVIKSRLQGAPNGTYKGFLDCAAKTVKADGVSALFRGFGPAMLRAFPANAATFVSHSWLRSFPTRLIGSASFSQLGVELSLKAMNSIA